MGVVRPLVRLVAVAGAVGARSAGGPGEEGPGRDRAVAGGCRPRSATPNARLSGWWTPGWQWPRCWPGRLAWSRSTAPGRTNIPA